MIVVGFYKANFCRGRQQCKALSVVCHILRQFKVSLSAFVNEGRAISLSPEKAKCLLAINGAVCQMVEVTVVITFRRGGSPQI